MAGVGTSDSRSRAGTQGSHVDRTSRPVGLGADVRMLEDRPWSVGLITASTAHGHREAVDPKEVLEHVLLRSGADLSATETLAKEVAAVANSSRLEAEAAAILAVRRDPRGAAPLAELGRNAPEIQLRGRHSAELQP